jgi:hypothetical protein
MDPSREKGTKDVTVASGQDAGLFSNFVLRIACLVPAEVLVWSCVYLYFGRDDPPPKFTFWWYFVIQAFAYGIADVMRWYISRRR